MPEVSDLLILQQKLRLAGTKSKLGNLLVNDTNKIVPLQTGVFWLESSGLVEAVSGLPEPVINTPFTDWMNKFCRDLFLKGEKNPKRISPSDLPKEDVERWNEFLAAEVIWVPLVTVSKPIGGLLISRPEAWKDEELGILNYWGLACGHAVDALWNRQEAVETWWQKISRRRYFTMAAVLILLAMMLPVDLSVNAPAEVVPKNPDIVRSPIEGIIGEVHVEPNQHVEAGELVLTFDDTSIKAQLDVVRQELAIARAEYQRANQASVSDRKTASQLPMLRARVEQRDAQVKYNQTLLERSRLYAEAPSIAVFPDAQGLEGRPVKMGEKILTLADPASIEVEFWLAVGDSIPLPDRARVELFLNVYPDDVHIANVRYVSYQAEVSPDGILGFRGRADLVDSANLRVGWRGTAQVVGGKVSVAYLIFRKPLSVVRQWTGL
ncbi:MAG: hypothetical protein ACI8Z1_003552 [Candidatus Azotimanducaceae bacterium]|jgi:hypothetical protein